MFCKNTPNVLQTPALFVLCSSSLGRSLQASQRAGCEVLAHPVCFGKGKVESADWRATRQPLKPSALQRVRPVQRHCPVGRGIPPRAPHRSELSLSHHPARAIARRLPPSTERRAPPGEPVGPNQRALLHLQYSCAAPCGPAMLVTQDPKPPCCAFATWRGPYAICDTGALPHSGQLHEGRARPRAPRTRLRRRAQSLQSLSAVLQTRIARQRPRKSAIASSRAPERLEQFQLRVHRFCAANRVHRTASVTVPARKAVKRNGT